MENWPKARCDAESLMRLVVTTPDWHGVRQSTRAVVISTLMDPALDADEVTERLRRAVDDDHELAAFYRVAQRQTESSLGTIPLPASGMPAGTSRWDCPEPGCGHSLGGNLDGPFGPLRCPCHPDRALELDR